MRADAAESLQIRGLVSPKFSPLIWLYFSIKSLPLTAGSVMWPPFRAVHTVIGVLLEEWVFCCHLVRTPWTLIQFKETARLLHATAAGRQETFLVFLAIQQPSLVQFQVEFHHAAAVPLHWLAALCWFMWRSEVMAERKIRLGYMTPHTGRNDMLHAHTHTHTHKAYVSDDNATVSLQ